MYIPLLQSLASPAASSSTSTTTTSGSTEVQGLNTMFLQLLTAQLKSQSPMSPLDPNQFVAQLAQFDSLSALTQIQELMQTLVKNTTPTPSSNPIAANAISAPSLNSSSH